MILKLARPILQRRAASVEVEQGAEKEWCETIQGMLRKTVLTKSCSSVRQPSKNDLNHRVPMLTYGLAFH